MKEICALEKERDRLQKRVEACDKLHEALKLWCDRYRDSIINPPDPFTAEMQDMEEAKREAFDQLRLAIENYPEIKQEKLSDSAKDILSQTMLNCLKEGVIRIGGNIKESHQVDGVRVVDKMEITDVSFVSQDVSNRLPIWAELVHELNAMRNELIKPILIITHYHPRMHETYGVPITHVKDLKQSFVIGLQNDWPVIRRICCQ